MTTPSRTRLLALVSGVVTASVLATVAAGGNGTPDPSAPPLGKHEVRCQDLVSPARRARASEARAASHMARSTFRPEQGLAALEALAEAADCHLRADDRPMAEHVRRELAAWRARVEREYRDRRLRLAYALRSEDAEAARRAADQLLALLGGRDDAYTRRLRSLVAGAGPATNETAP